MENTPQPAPTDAQPAAEPAAHDGTPHYGDFGHPADPTAPRHYQAPTNDGSNDNPDEFSAFRKDNGRGIPGSGKENEMPKSDSDKD